MKHRIKFLLSKIDFIAFSIICFGIYVSFSQYLYNRSLWLDEISLAINIRDRGFIELLKPLSDNQVAPIGYLWIVELSSRIFGLNEFSLRLPSLLFYVGSLIFGGLLFKKLFYHKSATYIGLTLIVLSPTLVYYGSELKQYTSDLFFCTLVFWLSTKITTSGFNKKNTILLASICAISIFMSNVAILYISCSFIFIILKDYQSKNRLIISINFAALCLVVLSVFLAYYIAFLYNHPTQQIMLRYWTEHNGFSNQISFNEFANKTLSIFTFFYSFSDEGKYISTVLFTLFCISLTKSFLNKRWIYATIIFLPLLGYLLCILNLYPYHSRLYLFLILPLSIAISYLIDQISYRFIRIVLIIFSGFILIKNTPTILEPQNRQSIREGVSYIQNNKSPDDIILTTAGSTTKVYDFYYNYLEYSHNKNTIKNWDPSKSLTEFKGKQVWIFMTYYYFDFKKLLEQLNTIEHKTIINKDINGVKVLKIKFD